MEYGSDRDIFGRRHSGDTLDGFPPRGGERSLRVQCFPTPPRRAVRDKYSRRTKSSSIYSRDEPLTENFPAGQNDVRPSEIFLHKMRPCLLQKALVHIVCEPV